MKTLAALLEELKEVDHKTHDEYFKLVEGTRYDHWPVWLADPITKEYTTESETIFNSIVQASIQRACERQEWHWLVCMDCWREGEYRAEMSIISESCISDMVEITTIAMKWGDSAAEALLAAYIAAVRVEAKR